jgi:hypothetical protein
MCEVLYEDERFPVQTWINSGSRLGYLEWLDMQIEPNLDDEDDDARCRCGKFERHCDC